MKDGVVFTPIYITKKMVGELGEISNKKVLEPSCGDGAFIEEISKKTDNYTAYEIKEELVEKVISKNEKNRGKVFLKNFLIESSGEFDCIIGNPPYIRIHDLKPEEVKFLKEKFKFCSSGNFDIFYAFIEKSLELLKDGGVIKFIVPNSWLTNSAARKMREEISKYDVEVEDFGSEIIFEGFGTYTCILTITKSLNNQTIKISRKGKVENLNKKDLENGEIWINRSKGNTPFNIEIKNGIATLSDNSFIFEDFKEVDENTVVVFSKLLKEEIFLEREIVKPAVKASTLKKNLCIFPYKKNGEPVLEDEMVKKYPKTYEYFLKIKPILLNRNFDSLWYVYGRSQSIKIQYGPKFIISPLVNKDGFKFYFEEDPNVVVYSGFFIRTEFDQKIQAIFLDKGLKEFVLENGRKMSGGWAAFNKKLLEGF